MFKQLTVEALRTKKKETIYHAAMLDPLTSSLLSLDQISSMVDELLKAHKNWIPEFN
jgi:Alpha-galactosidases/6-phospho-beta-glucosidases, family 4 of glycosyl hydrolases